MIRTIASIFITFAIVAALAVYEMWYVDSTFTYFLEVLDSVYDKTQAQTVTDDDGDALHAFWEDKKRHLHVWLPHTVLQEIDFQMNEAVGFIYQDDYEGALPKIKVLIGLAEDIPRAYTLDLGNIF